MITFTLSSFVGLYGVRQLFEVRRGVESTAARRAGPRIDPKSEGTRPRRLGPREVSGCVPSPTRFVFVDEALHSGDQLAGCLLCWLSVRFLAVAVHQNKSSVLS